MRRHRECVPTVTLEPAMMEADNNHLFYVIQPYYIQHQREQDQHKPEEVCNKKRSLPNNNNIYYYEVIAYTAAVYVTSQITIFVRHTACC